MSPPGSYDFAGITEIVRRRYETGEYGSAHFRVLSGYADAIIREFPPRGANQPAIDPPPIDTLMAIPVVVDDTIPEGTWRLVDTHTGEILHEGTT